MKKYAWRKDKDKKAVIFVVRKFVDIHDKIIPFFDKHKIIGVKYKDFLDWYKIANIMKLKDHLTPIGFKKICRIKENMNSYRD